MPVKTQSEDPTNTRSWRQVSKLRAFVSHLALSTGVVGIVLALVFFVWYPTPYSDAVGTWSVVRVLIGVDLVLGPLLTLIVFRPGKPGLLFDMSIIGLVQASALIYGITVLFLERPYFVVFAVDRFHVLARKDALISDAADLAWLEKPFIGPAYVAALLPKDVASMQQLIDETLFGGGPDIEQRPEFWAPYAENATEVGRRARSLKVLRDRDAATAAAIDEALACVGAEAGDVGFLPVTSSKLDASALVRQTDGSIVAVVNVNPWRND